MSEGVYTYNVLLRTNLVLYYHTYSSILSINIKYTNQFLL